MSAADRKPTETPSRGKALLVAAFVFALLMGAGPGIRLVDPGPSPEGPASTFLGLPILYAWGLLWFAVQVTVIVVAYVRYWNADEETE